MDQTKPEATAGKEGVAAATSAADANTGEAKSAPMVEDKAAKGAA